MTLTNCIHETGLQEVARSMVAGQLHPAQLELLELARRYGGTPALNDCAAVRLTGRLDVDLLRKRVEALAVLGVAQRAKLSQRDGAPVLIEDVAEGAEWRGFADVEAADGEADALSRVAQVCAASLDIEQEVLWRAHLISCGQDHHYLVFVVHRLLTAGGRGARSLLDELLASYAAPGPSVTSLPAVGAAAGGQSVKSEEQRLSHFQKLLSGAPPSLDLPTENPRPAALTTLAEVALWSLSPGLWEGVQAQSARLAASPYLFLQVCFQVLLHRYGSQDDLVLGCCPDAPLEVGNGSATGYGTLPLALRSQLEEGTSFRTLMMQTQQQLECAKTYAPLPLAALCRQLASSLDASRFPLFQVTFEHQSTVQRTQQLEGVQVDEVAMRTTHQLCELVVRFCLGGQGPQVQVAYCSRLYSAASIQRLLLHWENLLRAAVVDVDQRVYSVPLLTSEEYAQVVIGWNQTAVPLPSFHGVHELFEQQADRTPSATAAVFEEQSLTYLELDRKANRLAQHLRSLGVGPDVLVGVLLERSLEMAVAILATLKAGGAYVPLDPAYPRERLAFLFSDTQTPVLLTQKSLLVRLPEYSGQLVCMDDLDSLGSTSARLEASAQSHHLAYVIYTSGSTGQPKGICLPHLALMNLICWHRRTLLQAAKTLQFASLSFDASFHEMFAAWSSGGAVYFIAEELRRNVGALAHYISVQGIQKVILPVVVLQQLAEQLADKPQVLQSLRELTTTGEQLHITAPVVALLKQLPSCVVHNHYGPSETHVVTALTLTGDKEQWPSHPSIGKPIDNTTAFVLDRSGNPVPVGVTGELYLGGVCLARCYLGRPGLTADKFVAVPTLAELGNRLYKTGDLARYLPNGNIEFLGRIDHQVKIRGFRIELGEVESVLGKHPLLREVVVVAREDQPGQKRLVAYALAQPDALPTAAVLRSFLQERLPEYMIPAAFVLLEKMPLTHNGKIDRRALPAPSRTRPALAVPFVAPNTSTEEVLAEIFCEVLQLDSVGVNDNFFELGGDSLRAVQIFARVQQRLQIEVPFQSLFTSPTVAALAALVQKTSAAAPVVSVIDVVSRSQPLMLSFAQERMWFLNRLAPESPTYNCFYAFRLTGPLQVAALHACMVAMIQRHEVLRTVFVEDSGRPLQRILSTAQSSQESVSFCHLDEEQREAALRRELTTQECRPFDLAQGPLFRWGVVALSSTQNVLWWSLHHIITDGRSMEVMLRELTALYRAQVNGLAASLPAQPIQYADYATWQRRSLTEAVQQEHLAFFRSKLAAVPQQIELPCDFTRPAVQSFRGQTVDVALAGSLTDSLKRLGARHNATLSMVVLSGLATLVHRYTAAEQFILGIPSMGRDRVETESLLGYFVNILPVRIDAGGQPSFSQLLQRVQKETVDAFAHDALPFERLVQELQIQRSASVSPLIQIALAPQPPQERELSLSGLAASYLEVDSNRAVFDLTVFLWDDESGCKLSLQYSSDLFARSTVERIASHLQNLLMAAAVNPDCAITKLTLFSRQERQRLIEEWSRSEPSRSESRSFDALFAAQAAATPDAPALVETGGHQRTFSYQQLDETSNRLAHLLRARGVRAEQRVGVCFHRSADAVIAILAILKSGGAYVPLDPDYPRERLAFMIQDAGPLLILTQAALSVRLTEYGVPLLCIDEDTSQVSLQSCASLCSSALPSQLAYVIYTSGSTGKPKGVAVEHHNLTHLAVAQSAAFGLTASDRVLQFASLSFDASVSEIATTLLVGATLYLMPPGPPLLGAELGRLLQREGISLVTLPPSVLPQLPRDLCRGVRTLVVAGESSSAQLVNLWSAERRFINAYGPTECTVCATLANCRPGGGTPAIGRPMANVCVYVLDQEGQPQPVGIPGELFIGGAGVARGYLNQPELTAARFVRSPFSAQPDARLYRTGDLVRWRSDGELEFLGRLDEQIKLNGFRIELGEIEAVLREHPAVAEAVVAVQSDAQGERRLIGYVVPAEDALAARPAAIELWPSIAEYFVYDDLIYFALSSDELRNQIYRQSVARCVVGKVVLEIGTGAEAVLARMCAEEGARKVYAIEILEESYRKAKARIEELGLSDKIIIIYGDATKISLPEPVDVCVSEIVGAIGGSEAAAYILNQVRHLYAPQVRVIPERSLTKIAAITLPSELLDAPAFTPTAAHYTKKIFEQVGHRFDLRLCLRGVTPDCLISDVGVFEDLDFRTEIPLEAEHEVFLKIPQRAQLSGFLVWLNLFTADEDCIDILANEHSWIPVFLPVFGTGVQVEAGSSVKLRISRTLCHNQRNPDYTLSGMLYAPDGTGTPFSYVASHFGSGYRQNTFYDRLFADDKIAESALPTAGKASLHDLEKESSAGAFLSENRRLIRELRTLVEKRLPRYMVPAVLMTLDRVPLSATGKIDRRALPPPKVAPVVSHTQQPTDPLLQGLLSIWCELLGTSQIDVTDNFFEIGGHSLLAVRVVLRIQDLMGVELPLRSLYEAPTVLALAERIKLLQQRTELESLCFTPTLELDQEAVLDASIVAALAAADSHGASWCAASTIFLTGATGFVGAFLLAELLNTTAPEVQLHCLVRGSNEGSALDKLRRKLQQYGLWTPSFASRIKPILGDLSQHRLGLSEPAFAQLAQTIDVIYHCGAMVDHVRGYQVLKPANVGGTQEVLRLACTHRIKPMHFISTLSVIYPPTYMAGGVVHEDSPAGPVASLPNGYMQSKCVAEHLVQQAGARGLPVVTYRLGAITGHSKTSVCNLGDFFYSALRSAVQLGFADDLDTDQTLVPVDHSARVVVALSKLPTARGQVFHINAPQTFMWLELVRLLGAHGYPIQVRSFSECMEILKDAARRTVDLPIIAFLPFLLQKRAGCSSYVLEEYYANVRYDCSGTQRAMKENGIEPLPDPKDCIERYISYLCGHSLLQPELGASLDSQAPTSG